MAYTRHNWECGEDITDVLLNNIEDGVEAALECCEGGLPEVTSADDGKVLTVVDGEWDKADAGFKCTETKTVLADESITTAGAAGAWGDFSTSFQLPNKAIITFNNVEYECELVSETSMGDSNFVDYPFYIEEGAEGEPIGLMTPTAGTYSVKIESVETSVETTECFEKAVKEVVGESCCPITITYAELKALRDNGELIMGRQYKIIDYVCTSTNANTQVESHPFDVIVVADSESTLNENARAALKDGDAYYNVSDVSDNILESWEIKYCIDNDSDRFAWADSTNGKGVIYYMKDDRGNECPYDFKQIKFKRLKVTASTLVPTLVGGYVAPSVTASRSDITADEANPEYFFTFSYKDFDDSIYDSSIRELSFVYGNVIKSFNSMYIDPPRLDLPGNVMIGEWCYGNTFELGCFDNTLGESCTNNFFGQNSESNTFAMGCGENIIDSTSTMNVFGQMCTGNYLKNHCMSNSLVRSCNQNSLGIACSENVITNGTSNVLGDMCARNVLGRGCEYNTLEASCTSITLGELCSYNVIEHNYKITLANASVTNANRLANYHILGSTNRSSDPVLTISTTVNNQFVTYVGKNSSGVVKYYCPMDIAP